MIKSRYKCEFGRYTCKIKTHTSPKVINSQRLWGVINSQPYWGDKQPPTTGCWWEAERAAAARAAAMAAAARAAMVMAAAMAAAGRRRWQGWRQWRWPRPQLGVVGGGDAEERAEDGHVAVDGGQHEQHALTRRARPGPHSRRRPAVEVGARGEVSERGTGWRRMLRQGNAHRLSPRPCRQATY